MNDVGYMSRALALARLGAGFVNPNPMVGAVIVRDGEILGEGYHAHFGQAHAERVALAACQKSTRGATLYVTLEPCCHHGKTPPCTEAILEAGITRVVVGSLDPNPMVSGQGLARLRGEGVTVETGVLEQDCEALNRFFFHYIRKKTPFTVMKYAMTMDGKIATRTGASRWITDEEARVRVHEDRGQHSGILVGVGTVIADDPQLTCRLPNRHSPLRIICDSHLRTPLTAQVVQTAEATPTLLATCCQDPHRHAPYLQAGCEIVTLASDAQGRVNLMALQEVLGTRGLDSLLLEGGATINWAFLEQGLVQGVQCYVAPKLFGGMSAPTPIEGLGVSLPSEAVALSPPRVTVLGQDLLLESEVLSCLQGS